MKRRSEMAKLTAEQVARFVGGQMEIQNEGEKYIYRGDIETITVTGEGCSGPNGLGQIFY
jgi:hypothetical protein